jgi:hypothetical protein
MKKTFIIICVLFGLSAFAQIPNMPDSLNYQAVLRDASGNVLPPGTTGTLNFRIFSDFVTNTPDYEENHTFTTNVAGLVNLYIGGGAKVGTNTFANVNWGTGSACYQVSLNGTPIGPKQAFTSVPYALYAKTSGAGSLPPGLQNQTLYFDQATSVWKATNNLSNDGIRVGVGISPSNRIKLHVASSDIQDSTLIYTTKFNAGSSDALFRGIISGNTNTTTINPFAPIIGTDIRVINAGNGMAIGISGSANAVNSGTSIGMSAVARGPASSTLVGLYAAAADTTGNPNAYAAVFEKGKVAIGDAIVFPNASAVAGSVYKIDAQRRGYWSPAGAANITINQGGIVNVNPNGPGSSFTISAQAPTFQSTGLGSITLASYPNYLFNLPSPTFSFAPGSGQLTYIQGSFTTLVNLSPALGITSNSILSVGGSTLGIPALSYWSKPTFSTLTLGNAADLVGLGTNSPAQKLDVVGNVVVPAANDYLYAGAKTKYLSLSGYGFVSENDDVCGAKHIGGQLYAGSPATTFTPAIGTAAYFNSPINLPSGATITAVDAYVVDDDITYNISAVQLWRFDSPVGSPYGSPTIIAATPGTANANPNIQLLTTGAVTLPIDNLNYHYSIRFGGAFTGYGTPGQNIRLARVRVTYIINKAD